MYRKRKMNVYHCYWFLFIKKRSHTVSQMKLGQNEKEGKAKRQKDSYSCTFNDMKLLLSSNNRLLRELWLAVEGGGDSRDVNNDRR